MSLLVNVRTNHSTEHKGLKLAACLPHLQADAASELSSFDIVYLDSYGNFEQFLFDLELFNLPDVLLIEVDEAGKCFKLIRDIRANLLLKGIIIILLAKSKDSWYDEAKKAGVHDIYVAPFNYTNLRERIQFLVRFKLIKPRIEELGKEVATDYKMPLSKRLFDILFSGLLILFLSPLFLVVALIVWIESGWPVIYKSKRVGTGYKIFDFYKFRSMRKDADKLVEKMSNLNQYAGEDGKSKSAFVKFKNDPRITRIGHFIRRTSIDELPQLFNILKGDMSTVGNRPLPL